MAQDQKKRHAVSYENMSDALLAAFNEKYPGGYNEYFPDLKKYPKPDGSSFYAVTVETEDSIYLVKIKVKTDDAESLERWLDNAEDEENEDVAGSSADAPEESALPDDNISQYGEEDSAE
jgi:hypothetical protein